ncbi:MAG: phosphosulfolactate synthase [Flavobacteriales bacterium]|nr:phosphosulfolactate synthase [Flavobacteriales bacterium]
MKIKLPYVPDRGTKPRNAGVTMVMDKGLSLRQAEDLIESSGHCIDFVKLGFGTSYVTNRLEEKIELYKSANIQPYLGGTFFEAFLVRDMFRDYIKLLKKLKLSTAEISDGSIRLKPEEKLKLIKDLSKDFKVFSEVGSKEAGIFIAPNRWKQMMETELEAGAWKVIAEARESGTVGIYRPGGKPHVALINKILNKIPKDSILWEAPNKAQQAYFIKLLGSDVNLGNIAPDEVISLETLRLGMRGDTFFLHLPQELREKYVQLNEDGTEDEYNDDEENG